MESMRKFESRLIDAKSIEKAQEKRKGEAIDALDVARLEKVTNSWIANKEKNIGRTDDFSKKFVEVAEREIKATMEDSYDSFLEMDANLSVNETIHFWDLIFASKHPFFLQIKEEIEKKNKTIESEKQLASTEVKKQFSMMMKVLETLRDRSMNFEAWIGVLKEYRELLENYNRQLQEIVPGVRKSIAEGFITRINPDLEFPKTMEEITQVFNSTNLFIRDPLKTEKILGTHNGYERSIDLSLNMLLNKNSRIEELSPETLNLVAHEELHALSSGQLVEHKLSDSDGKSKYSSIIKREQWGGLAVSGLKVNRFIWLNEAMTETLSAQLVNTETVNYELYRELLDLLLTKGKNKIDKKLLTNAYFEKRGYQAPDENSQKFWNQFRQEIREAYDHDPQFLIKLDILIKERGIKEAIKLMKSWDINSPSSFFY